jgi:hypothetical protein
VKKAKRIDRVLNSLHSEEEVVRRLPEIEMIDDDEIRQSVIDTYLDGCPDYFWEEPSSSSGEYHSPDETGKHGNWLHVKRVFAEYCNLSESYVEAGVLTEWERDAGKAAALIHDMMKYGWPSENNQHTVSNHDVIAANVARFIGDVPKEVYLLIHAHMGAWGDGMTPQNERQWLLHFADKAASGKKEDNLAVYEPADELIDSITGLNQIAIEV